MIRQARSGGFTIIEVGIIIAIIGILFAIAAPLYQSIQGQAATEKGMAVKDGMTTFSPVPPVKKDPCP